MKGKKLIFFVSGCMLIVLGSSLIAEGSIALKFHGILLAMTGICISILAVIWRPPECMSEPVIQEKRKSNVSGRYLELSDVFPDLLDALASKQECFISDLALSTERKQAALHELSCMDENAYPLKQWKAAIEYLTGRKYDLVSVSQAKSLCYDLAGIRIGHRYYPGIRSSSTAAV